MLETIDRDRLLDLGLFGDEISQNLRLNGWLAPKLNGVRAELNRPLDDMAIGFFVAEDITEWEFRDHDNLVELKVMAKLSRCNQNGI